VFNFFLLARVFPLLRRCSRFQVCPALPVQSRRTTTSDHVVLSAARWYVGCSAQPSLAFVVVLAQALGHLIGNGVENTPLFLHSLQVASLFFLSVVGACFPPLRQISHAVVTDYLHLFLEPAQELPQHFPTSPSTLLSWPVFYPLVCICSSPDHWTPFLTSFQRHGGKRLLGPNSVPSPRDSFPSVTFRSTLYRLHPPVCISTGDRIHARYPPPPTTCPFSSRSTPPSCGTVRPPISAFY